MQFKKYQIYDETTGKWVDGKVPYQIDNNEQFGNDQDIYSTLNPEGTHCVVQHRFLTDAFIAVQIYFEYSTSRKIRLEIPGGHVDFTISSDVFDIPPCFAVSTPLQPTTNRPNEKKFRKKKKIFHIFSSR